MELLRFATGNKYKVRLFREAMGPEFDVRGFEPGGVEEKRSRSIEEVARDKLEQSMRALPRAPGWTFITDVGLSIEKLGGAPGALVKRETRERFGGDFSKWCEELRGRGLESSKAEAEMVICAGNYGGDRVVVDHAVAGTVPPEPQGGKFGFDWDCIFVPSWGKYGKELGSKSFAQVPFSDKLDVLMLPAIEKFKDKLLR